MGKGQKGNYKNRQKQKQLACIALAVTLVIIIIVLAVLYFSLFKPKDPKVQVPTMQLLSLYPAGYPAAITSDGSTACLYYYGAQVGFAAVPPASIPAQSFITLSVGLTVEGSTPLQGPSLYGDVSSGILQISTSVTIMGKVTTLNIFSHHSNVVSKCNINVSLNIRGIESYTCQRSFSLDT